MSKIKDILQSSITGIIFVCLFFVLIIGGPILVSNIKNKPRFEQGDFSEFTCEERNCQNSPTWKLTSYGQMDTYYYCDEHESQGWKLYNSFTSSDKSKNKNVEDSYGHDRFDAIVIAKKVVSSNLKSPTTAEFCGNSDYTISRSNNTWTVSGWVDAQNGFGATLRNNFTVVFTFTGNSTYTIDSCNIS